MPLNAPAPKPRLLRPQTWTRRGWLCALGVVLLLGVSTFLTWRHISAPERWIREAEAALERGDRATVDHRVTLLTERGRFDDAHFLRGKAHVQAGRAQLTEAVAAARSVHTQQSLFLFLDLGGLAAQPMHPRLDVVCQENSQAAPWTAHLPASQRRREQDERIRAAFQSGLQSFSQLSPDSPRRAEAATLSGDCYFRLGLLRAAAEALTFAVEQNPDDIESHRLLASIFFDLGAMDRSEHHANEIARLDPNDGRPLRMIGSIHKDFRNVDSAVTAYREALDRQLQPAARAEVITELAEFLIDNLGKHAEALELLKQCPPGFDNTPELWTLKANCLWQLPGDKREALRLVEAALQAEPNRANALVLRAKLHLHYDETEQAIKLLEKAAAIDAFDYKTRSQLAGAYQLLVQQAGDEVIAASALEALGESASPLGATPSLPGTLAWLAQTQRHRLWQARAAEHEQASQKIMKALTELTDLSSKVDRELWNPQIRCDIAKIWMQLQRPAMARMWLNAALSCDPTHQPSRAALRQLAVEQTAPGS
jgi:tetratricopeptide (TPR) repeat protein